MKKIFVIAALTALSVSCTGLIDPKEDALDGTTSLGLQFWCAAPETRATKPGEDKYNENEIITIDYFIFANAEEAAVKHERFTFNTTNEAKQKVDMGEFKTKYGVSGFVYALANMPETTQIGEETLAELETLPTLAELQTLPVPVTTFEQLENGKFNAQDSFVMVSDDEAGNPLIPFTLVENTTVEVRVPLSRRAAKISIDINVADYYIEKHFDQDKVNGTYVQTWFPTVESIQVYMLHFTDEGTMDGAKISAEETRFANKSYNRNGFIATISDKDKTVGADNIHAKTVTGTPFYTYPAEWEARSVNAPFIKVILQWSAFDQMQSDGNIDISDKSQNKVYNKEFYYKITIPDEVDFTSNYWYHLDLDLSVLGSEADDVYVTIPGEYSVVKWSDPDDVEGTELNSGRYLKVGGAKVEKVIDGKTYATFVMYGDKLDVPITTSHEFEVVASPSSSFNKFRSPYGTGSLTYSETEIEGANYTITPAEDFTYVSLEHALNADLGDDDFAAHDVSPITYSFRIQHIDDDSYYADIQIVQYPAIYISQQTGGNVFVDGRFYFQTNAPFDGLTARNYTFSDNNGNSFTGRGYNSANNNTTNNPGALATPYGSIRYDGGIPRDMTLVTVTAFAKDADTYTVKVRGTTAQAITEETYEYIIADPRQSAPWNQLDAYQTGINNNNQATTTAWSATDIAKIKVGTRSVENIIAPAFLISSRWGRPGGTFMTSLEMAEKRCATYQEAGFPAGRWRLPTEAEIYYVYTLQQKGLMDDLFSGNSGNYGYFASSGRVFDRQTGNFGGQAMFWDHFGTGSTNDISVRCVYDYWFWGSEDKVNENTFTPKP